MRGEEVAELVGGKLMGSPSRVSSFHFDSREVGKGALFVPLKGRRDGHSFIEEAFKRGAVGSLTEKEFTVPPGKFAIKVSNAFEAFKKVALYKRSKFSGTVVAVTGSVGKSTTKELLFHIFSPFFSTYRNKRSFNNEIGVTYTLSNLPSFSNLYIQEVGTNSPGEVSQLKALVKPQVSVITKVGIAHTEGFGSLEEIVREKFSLTDGVDLAVVPYQFSDYSKAKETITFGEEGNVRLVSLDLTSRGSFFTVEAFGEEVTFKSPVPGYSVVNSTLVGVAVSRFLGVSLKELPFLVETFTPPSGRLKVEDYGSTILIDDSYNANPASFENAIKVLSLFPKERVAVVGQMLELGPYSREEHRKLALLLEKAGVSLLVAYGKEAYYTYEAFNGKKFYFSEREELLSFFREFPLYGRVILVKGSRGNRLEEVCEIIRERLKS
ncbi:UDP-N-acetylmuramoyl-tripeptide--D-alanyl-D-alanine ligase [Thermovibrio guaymasensis]|uniref:UDP-N-acetylmuramoyl-tripeptide--D-alanyl-D-alanine ligase n=1 Tax=Thermovibrio guaymasensis TaxID=240167 RepID=A0A420W970_9BACT|nr:UDP-N-acetylmuramoyl-tripeptide--D-alanyl-D-alanine ligase [Thermovibrio guaymasensis]RKQ63812.1 UDP-N-acetylmuramoyl-tripeptide--D-alanyl-D-alanine ligase [Thermovibrio guaymasensis]